MEIKDSGNRTEFSSGAVRDMHGEMKGRCDLMPLDVVSDCFGVLVADEAAEHIFWYLDAFKRSGDSANLLYSLEGFCRLRGWEMPEMLLEVSIHYSEGSKKYGPDNWQKGIPLWSYLDSSIRHLLKYLRGDTDEPHDRAFCWNIICAIWTCWHKPELNEYAPREDVWNDEVKDNGCSCEANP